MGPRGYIKPLSSPQKNVPPLAGATSHHSPRHPLAQTEVWQQVHDSLDGGVWAPAKFGTVGAGVVWWVGWV